MPRTLLAAPTSFYFNSSGGSLGNDGLSPGSALPTAQAVVNLLYNNYDLGGQQVEIIDVIGNVDPGFRLSGLMVGQRGVSGVAFLFSGIIRPSGGASGVAIDSGAMCATSNLYVDCATQASIGKPQDCIQMGQGARLALYGSTTVLQNSPSFNGFTLDNLCDLEIQPQSWGSTIQNGGFVHFQGEFQDGFQTDQCSSIEANCNGQHGLIAIYGDAGVNRAAPYWAVAFADIASGVAVLSGIDFHGSGSGYRYRIRKGGTLDLNLTQDPNQVNALPGSASTAWSVQGYLI